MFCTYFPPCLFHEGKRNGFKYAIHTPRIIICINRIALPVKWGMEVFSVFFQKNLPSAPWCRPPRSREDPHWISFIHRSQAGDRRNFSIIPNIQIRQNKHLGQSVFCSLYPHISKRRFFYGNAYTLFLYQQINLRTFWQNP